MTSSEFKDDFDIEEPKKSSKKGLGTLLLVVLLVIVGFVIVKDPFSHSEKAKLGDTVSIAYVAKYENATVYKERTKENPLVFVLGSTTVVQGLEDQILGMKKGSSKDFVLTPEQGFAKYYDPAKRQVIPGIIFEQIGKQAKLGGYYDLGNIAGVVVSLDGSGDSQKIILDTNPLETRQNLSYHVDLLEIVP